MVNVYVLPRIPCSHCLKDLDKGNKESYFKGYIYSPHRHFSPPAAMHRQTCIVLICIPSHFAFLVRESRPVRVVAGVFLRHASGWCERLSEQAKLCNRWETYRHRMSILKIGEIRHEWRRQSEGRQFTSSWSPGGGQLAACPGSFCLLA